MKKLKPLSMAEQEMITYLAGETYPIPILDMANHADISTRQAFYLLSRMCKGLRIYRNEDYEVMVGVDEDVLKGNDMSLPFFEDL